MRQRVFIFLLFFLSPGWVCAEVFAQSGIDSISRDVSSRIDQKIVKSDAKSESAVKDLLAKPLTVDSAVQISLWNNKSLQAVLESWGIAKADFNKTRLPQNPTFGASVRIPQRDEPNNNVEFTVEQDFLSLILFPLKSNLAGAQLHKAELEITQEVLDLAFETKWAFYEVQGGLEMLSMRKRVLEQAEVSAELAKRQFEAGNISELDYANEKAFYEDTKLQHIKIEADLAEKKENLNRLMGFGGEIPTWEIKDELQEMQISELSYEELLSLGMSKRLDLLITRKNVEALKHALSLNRLGVLGHPEVGISTEKDVDGARVTGPTVRTDVPIYNLGQTEVSRSGAELKEAEFKLKALENDVRSEIKQKRDRLFATRALIEECQKAVIPNRIKMTDETQKHYNYMLLGNYNLIRAKQDEILAKKEYIEILKEYWVARSDIEKAVSSKLVLTESVSKPVSESKPAEDMSHMSMANMHHQGGSHE